MKDMRRNIINYGIFAMLALALVIAGYCYWQYQTLHPSTDDAYIQAHVINIAPQINGNIQAVFVHNQEIVSKNQLLFTIDPRPFEIALQKAQANLQNTLQQIQSEKSAVDAAQAVLSQRKAELWNTQKNHDRIITLVQKGYYAKSMGDEVTRQLAVAKQAMVAAENQLNEARATLGKQDNTNAQLQVANTLVAQAQLNLQYTKVVAPQSGQLAQFTLQPGQTVTAYESLFSLVENNTGWAVANMKETDLARIRVGQHARIDVDMYPTHSFLGVVKSIGAGSGASFSLLPAENATGNWVKVTQRFPVRIEIIHPDKQFPLRVGASCSVVIDTR